MSYEEDYRKPYRAVCACGKGFLRYYIIVASNDWGQTKEYRSEVEINCAYCQEHYYYHHGCLIPKGLVFPNPVPKLDSRYHYTDDEVFVHDRTKDDINIILSDMTAPKHHYYKNLSTILARNFAENWYCQTGKKSLKPMIDYLERILNCYDSLQASFENKKKYRDDYIKQEKQWEEEKNKILSQCFWPVFHDAEQEKRQDEERELAAHQYDDFQAIVKYHPSYKTNCIGNFWDSLYIKECIDPQYLLLEKPNYGTPTITIIKKYLCVCSICKKELVVDSSDFEIEYNESTGYFPKISCDCHIISSFEAKAMEILNNLGINYAREVSLEGLMGDFGTPLRFDFVIYNNKERESSGNPKPRLCLELQGPHHYKTGYYDDENGEFIEDSSNDSLTKYNRQISYDERKQEYCRKRAIPLECIKFSSIGNYIILERKLYHLLKKYNLVDWDYPENEQVVQELSDFEEYQYM